jgi:DNA-binding HxlR family transcriptional regulator
MTTQRPGRPAAPGPQSIHDESCPAIGPALELVGRRWTGSVLTAAAQGATRFSEYRAAISGISDRLLALRLKELGEAGLVERSVIPSTPVQVRYTLSPDGIALVRALQPLARWTLDREDDTPQ